MRLEMKSCDLLKSLAERRKYSNEMAQQILSEANKSPQESRTNAVGVKIQNRYDSLTASANEWIIDAYDASSWSAMIESSSEKIHCLSLKQMRWLFKHRAPASIHGQIGRLTED